jgi:hypothetical protein
LEKILKMSEPKQNQRLMITDHFDEIINQIDIKTETLFLDQSLTDETRNKLNEIREKQIEKIKEIKEINLNLLQNNEGEELELDLEKLIHFDCVLLEQPKTSLNGFVLWISSGFYNKENLEFLRY